jgi:glycosyltransferase involved in cell wall biosynthesis
MLRAAAHAAYGVRRVTRTTIDAARRQLAGAVLTVRPGWAKFAARIAGRSGLEFGSLDGLFRHMLQKAQPSAEAIPGRVVLVSGSLAPGGAERQVVYTLQGLTAHRFESVQLLCHYLTRDSRHRYDFYLPVVEAAGIRAREIRRRTMSSDPASIPDGLKDIARFLPSGLVVDIGDLYKEFSELRPQVVHAWLDWDNVRAGLAAALAGVPRVVISGRNINPSHFALYQPYMDPAYRVLARLPNVTMINNSRAGADDYARWIGIPSDHIRVVHNGIDFGNRSRLSDSGRADLREVLGIPKDSFLIGGVFRLEEEKRPILWVQAAALLARQVPNMHFVIFGQGTMHDAVLESAQREGIARRLTLAGITNDVLSAMSMMDVFLLTSFGEGLPNVLLEAQWVGTPVVVTDVGGAKEALLPGVTGWAVEPGTAQELAERIKWLHDNPTVLRSARTKGPVWVRRQFGIARMIDETIRAYDLGSITAGATSRSPMDAEQRKHCR